MITVISYFNWDDGWYVSNVSIIFYCSMLLYYHSWMFYNHFIVILYHFLVLTYRHSAQCQLLFFSCFLLRRKSIPNGAKHNETIGKQFWTRRHPVGQENTWGWLKGSSTHQGAPGGPGAPWWIVPTSGAPGPPLSSINTAKIPRP